MATRKHPDAKSGLQETAHDSKATPKDSDLETPHEDKESAKADDARRKAGDDAFRNEKAHEPPPKHQS
jgi:hypothetical protein